MTLSVCHIGTFSHGCSVEEVGDDLHEFHVLSLRVVLDPLIERDSLIPCITCFCDFPACFGFGAVSFKSLRVAIDLFPVFFHGFVCDGRRIGIGWITRKWQSRNGGRVGDHIWRRDCRRWNGGSWTSIPPYPSLVGLRLNIDVICSTKTTQVAELNGTAAMSNTGSDCAAICPRPFAVDLAIVRPCNDFPSQLLQP